MAYYMSKYSGEEIDGAIDKVVDGAVGGISNRNLLDNWDFRNPVNQRGQMSYSGAAAYCVDRFVRNSGINVDVTASGLLIACVGAQSEFFQVIEFPGELLGKTLTFSVEADGKIVSTTATLPAIAVDGLYGPLTTPWGSAYMQIHSASTLIVAIKVDSSITLSRCKLELGAVSTLANDPPADFGEELRKCQRYYQRIPTLYAAGRIVNASSAFVAVPTPVAMRVSPSATANDVGIITANGNSYAPSSISVAAYNNNQVHLGVTGTGFPAGWMCLLHDATIALSADL